MNVVVVVVVVVLGGPSIPLSKAPLTFSIVSNTNTKFASLNPSFPANPANRALLSSHTCVISAIMSCVDASGSPPSPESVKPHVLNSNKSSAALVALATTSLTVSLLIARVSSLVLSFCTLPLVVVPCCCCCCSRCCLSFLACSASCVLCFNCSNFDRARSVKLFPPPRASTGTAGDVPNPTILDDGTLLPRIIIVLLLSFSVVVVSFNPVVVVVFVYRSRKLPGRLFVPPTPAARSSPSACAMSFTASA